jgi:CheY-like chemotaxis protein
MDGSVMARILLIDDHFETREVVAQMLQLYGHSVYLAESAEAGWDRISHATPDAVVVDQRLPGMSGLALLRRIRETPRFRALPVVLCSGDDSPRDAALAAGAVDFWFKGSGGMFSAVARLGDKLGMTDIFNPASI